LALANGAASDITTPAAVATTGTYYIEICYWMLYCKISTGDGKPIANIGGKPRCSMFSTVDITSNTVQTTNTGTTTKYYTTLALANGLASDVTTPAAVAQLAPIISEVNLLLDALL
jgi:hypothetical protein